MGVYFLRLAADPARIKIGWSSNVPGRAQEIAGSVGAVTVEAVIDCGADKELRLHEVFRGSRIEGEWFESSPELESLIQVHSVEPVTYEPLNVSWRLAQTADARCSDAKIAARLLLALLEGYPATVARMAALEDIYLRLSKGNSAWSRRRVRSLWEGKARRIELFEIVCLLEAAGVPREEWADAIAPLQQCERVEAA